VAAYLTDGDQPAVYCPAAPSASSVTDGIGKSYVRGRQRPAAPAVDGPGPLPPGYLNESAAARLLAEGTGKSACQPNGGWPPL
jgi:hypothetical protein